MTVIASNNDLKALDTGEFKLPTPDDSEFIVRALASEFQTDAMRDALARDAAANDCSPSLLCFSRAGDDDKPMAEHPSITSHHTHL